MKSRRGAFSENLRIVWAITAKDILDAIKNRNTLANIVIVFLLMAFYQMLPGWTHGSEPPNLLVYDAGHSSLLAALEDSSNVDLYTYRSQQVMKEKLSAGDVIELGLVIPADFDQVLGSGEQPELEGYVIHWASDADASELKSHVEREIAELMGQPVRIKINQERVYPQPESYGRPFLTAVSLLLALTMAGMTVVPHLMIEEKQAKTIDVLRVSPAKSVHMVIAKALTGLFYCLTAVVVVFAFNTALITHWGLAILAAVLGSLFTVALGLLLGTLFEVKQQLSLWGFLLISVLLMPVFLSIIVKALPVPEIVVAIITWVPTVALSRVFQLSCSGSAPWGEFGPPLALVVGCTVLVLGAVVWAVRRAER
jgi:ABC-type Na+ efflux pump permease subunit